APRELVVVDAKATDHRAVGRLVDPLEAALDPRAVALDPDPGLQEYVLVEELGRVRVRAKGLEDRGPALDAPYRKLGELPLPRLTPVKHRVVRPAVEELLLVAVVDRVPVGVERPQDVALVLEDADPALERLDVAHGASAVEAAPSSAPDDR